MKNSVGAVNAGNNAVQTGNSVSATNSAELLAHIQDIKKELAGIPEVPAATTTALNKLEDASQKQNPEKSQLQEFFSSFVTSIASKVADASWAGVLKSVALVAVIVGL